MSRNQRAAACAAILLALSSCTGDKKTAKPSTSPSLSLSSAPTTEAPVEPSDTASSSAAETSPPAETASSSAAESSSSSPAVTESASPSPSATATASKTVSPPPDAASAAVSKPPVDPAQLAAAKALLVTGKQLGGTWIDLPVPAGENREQGDICGTQTAAEKDRLFDVSLELTNQHYDGAAQHTIARYKQGGAAAAARAMLDLLAQCHNVTQEFDGDSAVVNVTPQTPNMATFTITFKSGSVNNGGIAITDKRDYLSISTSYAKTPETAAELAGELDLRAQKKFADAGFK